MKKIFVLAPIVSLLFAGSVFAGEIASLPATPITLNCAEGDSVNALSLFFDWQDLIGGQITTIKGRVSIDGDQANVEVKTHAISIVLPDGQSIILSKNLKTAELLTADGVSYAQMGCGLAQ